MAEIAQKLHYRKSGATTDITLYNSTADVGGDYMNVRVGGTPAYAALGDAGETMATDMRVRKGGTTYAVMADNRYELPSGFIAMFQTACPSGWVPEGDFDGLFIRGASVGGGTGGADTHTHVYPMPDTLSGPYTNSEKHATGTNFEFASLTHTHLIVGKDITTADGGNQPKYFNVKYCRKV